LATLLRSDDVSHIAVAFDHEIESFRNQLFGGYKTGEGIDEDLLQQFPLAERAARCLGVVIWPMVEFEADDALATAAARFEAHPDVDQVVICTPDKDLAQCVRGRNVVQWDRLRDRIYDEEGVREKYGVNPGSIPDYLALVGDSADGIPGIARWGAKSTSSVLARYGSLEAIPERADDWDIKVRGAATLAGNLVAARGDAMLYRQLAMLREDVPIAESLEDLQWCGVDQPALDALAAELGITAPLA
jgi:5'-3' exonuclease